MPRFRQGIADFQSRLPHRFRFDLFDLAVSPIEAAAAAYG
jgi:hypothetical protein